jgi:DNA gyrase subunit B
MKLGEFIKNFSHNNLIRLVYKNKGGHEIVLENWGDVSMDWEVNKAKKSALEVVFTVLHAGGKFGGGGYKVSGGLHGVGASVVNALSTWLTVEVYKDGNIYRQSYKRGKTDDTVKIVGQCDESLHGTKVHFLPDPEIFEETVYDYDTLKQRLRETAFLTKGLKITLKDVRENSHHNHVFHYEGGIKEFVEYLNRSITKPFCA